MILNEAAFLGLIMLDFQILFTVLGIKLSFTHLEFNLASILLNKLMPGSAILKFSPQGLSSIKSILRLSQVQK